MPTITDPEFGDVTVRRSPKASSIRIRVAPDGRLRASLPMYAPLFMVRRLLKNSRDELRTLLGEATRDINYEPFQQIGKSHTLMARSANVTQTSVKRHGQHITVTHPPTLAFSDDTIQRLIRDEVTKALRIEAKSYLPRRLGYLAERNGFSYQKVRFSHASGRWGSCSTSGTISLNIALMKLPFELIDYVLIHELCHTREMNHSANFWALVEASDPDFKAHRKTLKTLTPSI